MLTIMLILLLTLWSTLAYTVQYPCLHMHACLRMQAIAEAIAFRMQEAFLFLHGTCWSFRKEDLCAQWNLQFRRVRNLKRPFPRSPHHHTHAHGVHTHALVHAQEQTKVKNARTHAHHTQQE
jgi:hypothetical protein